MKRLPERTASSVVVVEGGIAKSPAGRLPDEARAEAEAAYARAPSDRVWRIDEGTSLDEVNAADLAPGTTVLFKRGDSRDCCSGRTCNGVF